MSARAKSRNLSGQLRRQHQVLLLALLAFVCLTGGGSRADIESLAILRFVSALAVCAALLMMRREDFAYIRTPLVLLALLAVIAGLQLVPLPAGVWTALPGREAIGQLDTLLGFEVWRPVSLSPFKTANSLASLIVPLAILLLFAVVRDRTRLLGALVAIGTLGALLGIIQLFAAPSAAIYFYEITNRGEAVGLFANRNHHAVFLACCVLISLHLMRQPHGRGNDVQRWGFAACALVLTIAVLGNASRAGLISLFLVGLFSAIAAVSSAARASKSGVSSRSKRQKLVFSAAMGAAASTILILFAFVDRSPALSRLVGGSELAELRSRLLPYLLEMAATFQPAGVGMGAFEYAYRMREPVELIGQRYLNNAHNDWLQFIIEGGALALAVMAIGAVVAIVRAVKLMRSSVRADVRIEEALLGLALLVVLAVASLVDYPLRVPSIMALAIIALGMFTYPANYKQLDDRAGRKLTKWRSDGSPNSIEQLD